MHNKKYTPHDSVPDNIENMKQASRIFKEASYDLIDSIDVSDSDKKYYKSKVDSETNHIIEYICHAARHGKRMRNF